VTDCTTDCSAYDTIVDPNSQPETFFSDIAAGLTAQEQCNLQRCPLTACVESANFAALTDPATDSAFADQDTMQADLSLCGSERCSECEVNFDKSFAKVYASANGCQNAHCTGICSDCTANFATHFHTQYWNEADCQA
jgi:hypothetical protein